MEQGLFSAPFFLSQVVPYQGKYMEFLFPHSRISYIKWMTEDEIQEVLEELWHLIL